MSYFSTILNLQKSCKNNIKNFCIFLHGTLVCLGCCNKGPQTGQFKQRKCVGSQFWRLKSNMKSDITVYKQDGFLLRVVRVRSAPGLSP